MDSDVSKLIEQVESADDPATAEKLLPLVYDELRRLAACRMKNERDSHSLTPTALVHEAVVRLVGKELNQDFNGKKHLMAAVAMSMRRILVDHFRKRNAQKRGGGARKVELLESRLLTPEKSDELLALDESLTRFELVDAEAAKLIELRFFVGLTNSQAAEQLGISPRKADQLWAFGRAWLKKDMSDTG